MTENVTEKLTENERKFVALALQGLAMRGGPPVFHLIHSIARKLELEAELRQYLQDWINYKPGSTRDKET